MQTVLRWQPPKPEFFSTLSIFSVSRADVESSSRMRREDSLSADGEPEKGQFAISAHRKWPLSSRTRPPRTSAPPKRSARHNDNLDRADIRMNISALSPCFHYYSLSVLPSMRRAMAIAWKRAQSYGQQSSCFRRRTIPSRIATAAVCTRAFSRGAVESETGRCFPEPTEGWLTLKAINSSEMPGLSDPLLQTRPPPR